MAIRIDQGTSPQYGRVTLPKGTYLSSPSTAADGVANGATGTNPGPGVPEAWLYNVLSNPAFRLGQTLAMTGLGVNPQGAWGSIGAYGTGMQYAPDILKNAWQVAMGRATPEMGIYNRPVAWGVLGNPETRPEVLKQLGERVNEFMNPKVRPTGALQQPFVGKDIGTSPEFIAGRQIQTMFPGLTPKEIAEVMHSKGYAQTYQSGVGDIWVKVTPSTGQPSAPETTQATAGDRPQYVDPTTLEPGERVTLASGVNIVGGTPTAEGQAQYAVTLPGVANDPKGMYKWKTTVKKDADGNWVRVYQQVLRKVYTRSHRKKQQQRAESAISETLNAVSSGELNQLVNLRADFG